MQPICLTCFSRWHCRIVRALSAAVEHSKEELLLGEKDSSAESSWTFGMDSEWRAQVELRTLIAWLGRSGSGVQKRLKLTVMLAQREGSFQTLRSVQCSHRCQQDRSAPRELFVVRKAGMGHPHPLHTHKRDAKSVARLRFAEGPELSRLADALAARALALHLGGARSIHVVHRRVVVGVGVGELVDFCHDLLHLVRLHEEMSVVENLEDELGSVDHSLRVEKLNKLLRSDIGAGEKRAERDVHH
mmetsp:Transcript_7557/g.24154  ORF Transcript_7557/g.24154 Transcript_7557/m.24154 type:complete len:245 (+) Transcript_7557:83-817(+)